MLTLTINGQRYALYIGREELDAFFNAMPDEGGELFTSWPLPDDNTHYYGGDVPMYTINGYRPDNDDGWSSHDRSIEYLKKHLKGEAVLARERVSWDEFIYWSEDGKIVLSEDVNDCLGGIFGWTC